MEEEEGWSSEEDDEQEKFNFRSSQGSSFHNFATTKCPSNADTNWQMSFYPRLQQSSMMLLMSSRRSLR